MPIKGIILLLLIAVVVALLFHNEITLVFNFKYKNVWKQYSMRFNTQ